MHSILMFFIALGSTWGLSSIVFFAAKKCICCKYHSVTLQCVEPLKWVVEANVARPSSAIVVSTRLKGAFSLSPGISLLQFQIQILNSSLHPLQLPLGWQFGWTGHYLTNQEFAAPITNMCCCIINVITHQLFCFLESFPYSFCFFIEVRHSF